MAKKDLLSVIVPVFNEQDNIPVFLDRIIPILKKCNCDYEIIFSMDPSTDGTEQLVLDLRKKNSKIKLLKFSRRFGQPAATMGGLRYCTGDAAVVIDVDLQDPPELIETMVRHWREGYQMVYAQRTSRKGETLIKRLISYSGYFLINRFSEVPIPRNTGDFRLLSRVVIDELCNLEETHGFLRGLAGFVGFNQIAVPYERDARLSGTSNYNPFTGSLRIGLNGVFSFSRYPLQLISLIGLGIAMFSILIGFSYIVLALSGVSIAWGNPTLVILVTLLAGVQLFSLGIMGEYIGRIYEEVKRRPMYIVAEAHGINKSKHNRRSPRR